MSEMFGRRPSRRSLLRIAAVLVGAAAASAVPPSRRAAAAKAPKSAVGYQDRPNDGQKCGDCRYFLAGESPGSPGSCQLVEGDISPRGWCSLFAPKS